MYYGLIILSVVMFGGCFALNDVYRKMRGSSFKVSLENTIVGAVAGIIALIIYNGARFEFTPFTLIMATLGALNAIGFAVCSLKALDYINLSVFSLFSMLGGMLLPFLQGILFYNEGITVAKVVCIVLVVAALLLTVSWGKSNGGMIYYVSVFVFNGMSGVLSKIFTSAPFEKTSAAAYSIWQAVIIAVITATILVFIRLREGKTDKDSPKLAIRATSVSAANGILNKVANFILIIALVHVQASVQYPMVTGGTIIVCTCISFLGDKKPTAKDILSVLLAFAAMFALLVIPI